MYDARSMDGFGSLNTKPTKMIFLNLIAIAC